MMHFDLMKNKVAAVNNERVVQIDFIFLPYYPELKFFSILLLNLLLN